MPALNEALKEEITAINQYFLHAETCENWDYKSLLENIRKESIDEMRHADALIERSKHGSIRLRDLLRALPELVWRPG